LFAFVHFSASVVVAHAASVICVSDVPSVVLFAFLLSFANAANVGSISTNL
jgi:hypothetical protein